MMTSFPTDVPRLGRHSPRLAQLREMVRRRPPGVAVVDGVKLVVDLTKAGLTPELVLLTSGHAQLLSILPALVPLVTAGRAFSVSEAVMERLAPSRHPQGVLALFPVLPRALPSQGRLVYLDRVQDPANVGAVVRCAAALGAAGVVCSPGCADPFSPSAVRASAGQALLFPVRTAGNFGELASAVRSRGGGIAALAGRGGVALSSWHASSPLLLALGNEGSGLDPAIAEACDVTVTIPLQGGVESLNVAVAAGIVLAALAGLVPSPILE